MQCTAFQRLARPPELRLAQYAYSDLVWPDRRFLTLQKPQPDLIVSQQRRRYPGAEGHAVVRIDAVAGFHAGTPVVALLRR